MDFHFSDELVQVLEFSRDEALRTGWHNICPDHIMLGLLRHYDNAAYRSLEALGLDPALLKAAIDEAIFVSEQIPWEERESIHLSESSLSLLQAASLEAARCGSPITDSIHFLFAICRMSGSYTHDALCDGGVSLRALVEASGLEWARYGLKTPPDVRPDAPTTGHIPDPAIMAAAIEQRLLDGYTPDNPIVS